MRLCSLGLGLGGIHSKTRLPGGDECWLFLHIEGSNRQNSEVPRAWRDRRKHLVTNSGQAFHFLDEEI